MLKIYVVIGSVRQGRFADKPAQFVFEELKKRQDVAPELIDIKDLNLPLFDEPVSPAFNEGKYARPEAAAWAKKVAEADGFIFITPEYNHGYTAALKNILDYVYKEWNNKPIAFFSYGGISGGTRAVQQLRQVAIELQMFPIRNGVHIPLYWTQLDEKGNIKTDVIQHSTDAMIDQLLLWAKNLKGIREKSA